MSSKRALLFILPALALLLVGALLAGSFSGSGEGQIVFADNCQEGAYSASAIGHLSYYEILRRDWTVVERRLKGEPLPQKGPAGIILANPIGALSVSSAEILSSQAHLLVILPKWVGIPDGDKPAWLSAAEWADPWLPQSVLADLLGEMGAGEDSVAIYRDIPAFDRNELSVAPTFAPREGVQLARLPSLKPIVAAGDRVLLGETSLPSGAKVWILADPDPLSNFGIGRGANLEFALALNERFTEDMPRNAPLVFAETYLAPLTVEDSFFAKYFKFPRVLVLLLSLASAILLAFLGLRRHWPAMEKEEPVFGKRALVRSSARLLERGGQGRALLARYFERQMEDLGKRARAPQALFRDFPGLLRFLDGRVPRRNPLAPTPSALYRALQAEAAAAPDASRLLSYAQTIHSWKEDWEHGSRLSRPNR
ncbi:MAG: hypothetical protein LBO66_14420 [Deltaproteobacteria bacterium]|nr:hypothetical protein [Deltaproteobacteria bacterium]